MPDRQMIDYGEDLVGLLLLFIVIYTNLKFNIPNHQFGDIIQMGSPILQVRFLHQK